ncbi:MAG: phenylalanine--tRNA ligase beta subunit-related protein [Bacteroidota bacterium]|nr:phenylalanine--tRNA ligase beta subunit-related protein [Bacteroidota bacterium]
MVTQEFIIHPEIRDIGLNGIYLTIENIRNKDTDAEFELYSRKIVQQAYNYSRQLVDIKEDDLIKGFRQLHDAVGVPNRKNLSAPENLYKLLTKKGDIPRINLLVDIYNTISVKYRLALGAHDWDRIDGNVHLRFTSGTEKFIPLGEDESIPIRAGAYSYIDDSNEIICYLDVRQIEKTKVTLDTKNVFIVIQGNANTPFPHIENAVSELVFLIKKYDYPQSDLL